MLKTAVIKNCLIKPGQLDAFLTDISFSRLFVVYFIVSKMLYHSGFVLVLVFGSFVDCSHRSHTDDNIRRRMLASNRTPSNRNNANQADACDLRGAWYNQLGSELYLNQTENGQLFGEYRTAVTLSASATVHSETNHAAVHGSVVGRIFTFHVFWRESSTLTTWTGQCHRQCDFGWHRSEGVTLHTTWLHTSTVERCDAYWSANRIGEDLFTRLPLKAGPRRNGDATVQRT